MTAQAGRKLILSIGNGALPTESFTAIGALEQLELVLERRPLDATHAAGNDWQTLQASAAPASVHISAEGVFEDSAAEELLRAAAFDGLSHQYRVQSGNGDVMAASFVVERYARRGRVGELERFALSLRSNGAVSFVAG